MPQSQILFSSRNYISDLFITIDNKSIKNVLNQISRVYIDEKLS